jgi:hypothetical protein
VLPEFTLTINNVLLEIHPSTISVEKVHFHGFVSRRKELHRVAFMAGKVIIGSQFIPFNQVVSSGFAVDALMKNAVDGNSLSCYVALDTREGMLRLVGVALTEHRHVRRYWDFLD